MEQLEQVITVGSHSIAIQFIDVADALEVYRNLVIVFFSL